MAQSKEWPDLKWIPPKSYTPDDRGKGDIKWVVIHDTEGSAHGQSAEDGARYNQTRDDGTSAHYFFDNNSGVHCVHSSDRAHTARRTGNLYGLQYELCGRASWSQATWLNDYGRAMLELTAEQVARDCKKFDIPVRHLTVAQVRNKERGICSHWDITRAFPEDNGTHTDPGPNFPWTHFLNRVRFYLAPPKEEDDMPDAQEVAEANWKYKVQIPGTTGEANKRSMADLLRYLYSKESIAYRVDELVNEEAIAEQVVDLTTEVTDIKTGLAEVKDLVQQLVDGSTGTDDPGTQIVR
jgi:N-acetyl-anhydromuramyl-L-alanine amidase AmpD